MSPTSQGKLAADRVEYRPPGEAVEAWIYSAFPKDNWTAHKPGDQIHIEYPGTAVQLGGTLYEVTVIEEVGTGGYAVRYGLKKWNPHHAVRRVIPFDSKTQAQMAADYLEEAHRQALRARILYLFPLAGLAPDPLQREWGAQTALNMAWASAGSAVFFLLVPFSILFVFRGRLETGPLHYVLLYLILESFLRILWVVTTQKPHGSVVLTAPYILWSALTQQEKRAQKKEAQTKFSYEGDEVLRRHGTGTVVVRSMLYDDILAGPLPVRFEGAVYRPLHWHREGKGLVRRWVYELEKIEADPKTKCREYTQPRSPERQRLVEAFTHAIDVAQSFAPVWGVYPREEQLRLELKYQYAAAKNTAITAVAFLLAALVQIWLSILFHFNILALIGPAYLILESIYRLVQSQVQHQPAGSVVGYVLGLVIHPPQ